MISLRVLRMECQTINCQSFLGLHRTEIFNVLITVLLTVISKVVSIRGQIKLKYCPDLAP